MIWGVAGVFFLKVLLYYIDDSRWVCCDVFGGWISCCVEFGLVFGVRLLARRGFEVVVVALRALFI